MFGLEKKLFNQILKLRDEYGLQGIKAEFEAEGSSYADLVRLRRLTDRAGIGLFLKIGGVEAVRDLKDALELGVDGLIAPMAESPFGIEKFYAAYRKIFGDHQVHLSVNLETRTAAEKPDEYMNYAKGRINNITVGRSDLSASYFDSSLVPDSPFILDLIEKLAQKAIERDLTITVGGKITVRSLELLRERPHLTSMISRLETRKVILPTDSMLAGKEALQSALRFEELYILSKKEFSDNAMKAELSRLTDLQRRQ